MTSKNDITGDLIKSKGSSRAYEDNWDRIFGKNKDINNTEPKAQKQDPTKLEKEHAQHKSRNTDRSGS